MLIHFFMKGVAVILIIFNLKFRRSSHIYESEIEFKFNKNLEKGKQIRKKKTIITTLYQIQAKKQRLGIDRSFYP